MCLRIPVMQFKMRPLHLLPNDFTLFLKEQGKH